MLPCLYFACGCTLRTQLSHGDAAPLSASMGDCLCMEQLKPDLLKLQPCSTLKSLIYICV